MTNKPVRRLLVLAMWIGMSAGMGCSGGESTTTNPPVVNQPVVNVLPSSANEGDAGNSPLTFSITLSSASTSEIRVEYATSDGSAQGSVDFQIGTGSIVFSAGETSRSVDVGIIGDSLDEIDEVFSLAISNPVGAVLGTASANGTIIDDDVPPTASVTDVSAAEGDAGTSVLNFVVSLSSISGRMISVDYATADGTATTADLDYVQASGTTSIAPGVLTALIPVQITGDTTDEGDETFTINLSNEMNTTLAGADATGTILNDDGAGPVSGLPARPANLTCIAPARPTENASISTEQAFPGVSFTQPVVLIQAPADNSQWYVAQQNGLVLRFANASNTATTSTFVDLRTTVDSSASESGLLGMAFHPDYTNNRYVFVSYTETGPNANAPFTSVVARYESLDNGLTLSAGSEVRLLEFDQPFENHNGGHLVFGPDGYLYAGFGDGGSAGDPLDLAQDTRNLFGSLIRIDVDGANPYEIPVDNEFAGNALCNDGNGVNSCPEIYAWGLRNPWRWEFDIVTGQLWLGDVGQNSWEEIDVIEAGGNYGWRCREGAHDFNLSGSCPVGLSDPVIEYDSNEGNSITGGFVYRGAAISELAGRYIFADFVVGKIFASVANGQGGFDYEVLLDTNFNIASFALEQDGELLFLNYGGDIRRIIQSGGVSNNTIPDLLSDTGCVDPADPTQPYSGLIPYDINALFWSDGAQKERWYAIPDGTSVDVDAAGDWVFPIGSVLVKNFRLGGVLFETRLFMRHTDGSWAGYTYEWNGAGTDANRVIGGKTATVNGQQWIFPSESQCMECHTQVAGYTLGPEHSQLNRSFTYPSSGITANQLVTADFIDVLSAPLSGPPGSLPQLADPQDVSATLVERARAYLHTNCSGCHRPAGPTPSNMDLRHSTSFLATNTCNEIPLSGNLGIVGARIVAPGDAGASILVNRVNRRDIHGMPPLGSNIVDVGGISLLTNWISALGACP